MTTLCVKDGQKFLFIGDSITDMDRRYTQAPFGNGYVSLFIELQRAQFPERNIRYVNKGIGGDTCTGMRDRWMDDVIREQPDWLSIKIGINDCVRCLKGAAELGVDAYRKNYDAILSATRKQTKAKVVLTDPFFLSTDMSGMGFRTDVLKLLPSYIDVVHEMSAKYKTRLVRTHEMFQGLLKYMPPDTFCPEPVHPNRNGHLCIALEYMKVMA